MGRLSIDLGSDYNRLDLSKGDKQTIKISWSDDGLYWGDEELFEALYNTNFCELTFTCEIWRIEFSDDYTYTN